MNKYDKEIELYFELKGSPDSSKESYLRRMKAFINFLEKNQKDIENLTVSDIQQYILYLKKEKKLSAGTINNYISAIRFFYTYVLNKEWNPKRVPRMKRPHKLPLVIPKQDVLAILDQVTNLKHKAILALIYSSGLRVSEVARLRICDICSKNMTIRVDHAKHGTDRYTILSTTALTLLREYFKLYLSSTGCSTNDWLFPGQKEGEHIHVKTIKNTLLKLRDRLQLDKRVSAHTLRHCFATHALEDGVEPVFIQQLLGHKNFETTSIYLRMTSKSLMGTKSPLDTGGSAE